MEKPELIAAISAKLAEDGWPDRYTEDQLIEAVLKAARIWEAEHAPPLPGPSKLVAIEPTDVPGLEPLQAIRLEIGPGKHSFVFTISEEARDKMGLKWVQNVGQVMGNLVHPAQCALVVVPDGQTLSAYEVKG